LHSGGQKHLTLPPIWWKIEDFH